MKNWFFLFFPIICQADFVLVGGVGSIGAGSNAPEYMIGGSVALNTNAFSLASFPSTPNGTINAVAINPITGIGLFIGNDAADNALAYQMSVLSLAPTPITFPPNSPRTNFIAVAFDSLGNAILVGTTPGAASLPIIYRLPYNATELVRISVSGSDEVQLNNVAISTNGTAIVVGQDLTTSAPIAYAVTAGSTQAEPIAFPNGDLGTLDIVVIVSDGSSILAGQGDTAAIIYRLPIDSLSAETISIPDPNNNGNIYDGALAPDNSVLLVGSYDISSEIPLIYQLPFGGTSVSIVTNANPSDTGHFNSVAIDTNGSAIIGGHNNSTHFPLVYQLSLGSSQATSVPLPNNSSGEIFSVGIGAQNIAVLGGHYSDSSQLLIWTLPTTTTNITSLNIPTNFDDIQVSSVSIYPCNGSYDVRQIRPYYYWQGETTSAVIHP